MNRLMKKRIEKLEAKTELIKADSDKRKAMLMEIKRLEKKNPLKATLLKLELEYGRKATFLDLVMESYGEKLKDIYKAEN